MELIEAVAAEVKFSAQIEMDQEKEEIKEGRKDTTGLQIHGANRSSSCRG